MPTVTDALCQRRSIRCFKPDPVDRQILKEIISLARWSPSWGNTQPWRFWVFQGASLEKIKDLASQRVLKGEPFQPEIPMPAAWPEALKKRYGETGKLVLSSLGIEREDKKGRGDFYVEMSRLFGAPCLIVGTLPREVAVEYAMLDMGIIIQSICLAAYAYGLGSCIMAASVGYPDIIRQVGNVDVNTLIVMGIALGYAEDAPINRFPRPRIPVEEMVTWVD